MVVCFFTQAVFQKMCEILDPSNFGSISFIGKGKTNKKLLKIPPPFEMFWTSEWGFQKRYKAINLDQPLINKLLDLWFSEARFILEKKLLSLANSSWMSLICNSIWILIEFLYFIVRGTRNNIFIQSSRIWRSQRQKITGEKCLNSYNHITCAHMGVS